MFEEIKLPSLWADWKIVELLGIGSYGTVYKAERRFQESTETMAVKIIKIPDNQANELAYAMDMHNPDTVQAYYRGMVDDFLKEVLTLNMLKAQITECDW